MTTMNKEVEEPEEPEEPEEIEDDEDRFNPCDECDLPDACHDYGCAIKFGIKRRITNL